MLKIRRSRDSLIINMGIPIPGNDGLYIKTGPWSQPNIATRDPLQYKDHLFILTIPTLYKTVVTVLA